MPSDETSCPILVVDDDPLFRTELRVLLNHHPTGRWQAIEADSVKQALSRLQSGPVSLAIVDIHLPDGTARDFIRQAGTLPCILCTQDRREPTFTALFNDPDITPNLVGYLTKPLEPGVIWSIRAGLEIGRERDLRSRAVAEATARIEQERLHMTERLRDAVEVALTQLDWTLDEIQETCQSLATRPQDPKYVQTQVAQLDALRAGGAHRVHRLHQELACTLSRLHPGALDVTGLPQATEQLMQEWRATAPQVAFSLVADPQLDQLAPHKSSLVYRLIQDALTLAMRSTAAQHVAVTLRHRPAWLSLEVHSRGSPRLGDNSTHVLSTLQTRTTALGGKLQFECDQHCGGGRLLVQLPV